MIKKIIKRIKKLFRKKQYIHCPKCKSVDMEIIRWDGHYLIMVMRCKSCSHQWFENIDFNF